MQISIFTRYRGKEKVKNSKNLVHEYGFVALVFMAYSITFLF